MEKQFTKHKHYEMGTGNGKFKFIGVWSAPSSALLEANPSAYNNQMNNRPKCCKCTCDCCGTGIIHHMMIQDSNGERFSVGSSCIGKLNDHALTTASKEAEKKRKREINQAKAQAKRDIRNQEIESENQRQRDVNGGLTDWEVTDKARLDAIELAKEQRENICEPLIEILSKQNGDFCASLIRGMIYNGNMPYGYAKNIVIEIMTKQFGRKNSKKYNEAYDSQVEIFENVEKEFNKIK
jgi:hypothetical protein